MAAKSNKPPTGFLELPDDVLIPILGYVGADSLAYLIDTALTCRRLSKLITRGEQVWRACLLQQFDDPREACAFLTPRSNYSWKETLVERRTALMFLRTHTIPYLKYDVDHLERDSRGRIPKPVWRSDAPHPSMSEWAKVAPVVFRAVLGLYDDLPAKDLPSKNAAVLEEVLWGDALGCLLGAYGPLYEEANRLTALFRYLPQIAKYTKWQHNPCHPLDFHAYERELVRQHQYRSRTRWIPDGVRRVTERLIRKNRGPPEVPACTVPSDKTPWHFMAENCQASGDVPHPRLRYKQPEWVQELDVVRGTGLRYLHPPPQLGENEDLWDWAMVGGQWWLDHLFFDLLPVKTETDLRDHLEDCRLPERIRDQVWELMQIATHVSAIPPDDRPESRRPPPLYIVGKASYDPITMSTPLNVVHGLVHLTNDSPPEIRWTFIVSDHTGPSIIQGIQLGGLGSSRGVVGRYIESRWVDTKVLVKPTCEELGVWVYKTDGLPQLTEKELEQARADDPALRMFSPHTWRPTYGFLARRKA